MSRIHIFRTGKHTSAEGVELEYTADMLKGIVENYDTKHHIAPIVLGHPQDGAESYGWISGMEFDEETGNLYANAEQVSKDLVTAFDEGRYKKVSASFYTPHAPNNPFPGGMTLRHLGVLGAQVPAVKSLEPVSFSEEQAPLVASFSDDEKGVPAFEMDNENFADFDQAAWSLAEFARSMRDWMIDKFGLEEADKVISSWQADDFKRASEASSEANNNPEYSEGDGMTEEELKAAQAQLEKDQKQLKTDQDSLKADQTSFAEQKQADRKQMIADRIDKAVEAGKVLPANRDNEVAFCESLSAEANLSFSEDDKESKVSPLEHYLQKLEAGGSSSANFDEHSSDDGEHQVADLGPVQIGAKIQNYMDEQAAKGVDVSYEDAAAHVQTVLTQAE